jgi:DoxX-like family
MNADTDNRSVKPVTVSKGRLWSGRILSTLPVLLLLMSGVMDLMKPDFVVKAMVQQGFPEDVIAPLGIALLICTILYAVPRTAILGTILLTGYLGGAVATHVRAGDPLFSHVLAPVYFAVILWIGLYLREPRLSALVPLRS